MQLKTQPTCDCPESLDLTWVDSIGLSKQLWEDGFQNTYERIPKPDSEWRLIVPNWTLREESDVEYGLFPSRIEYLESIVQRYYPAFPNDYLNMLPGQSAHKFYSMLTKDQQLELQTMCGRIQKSGDSDWLMKWIFHEVDKNESENRYKTWCLYFIAFLDRLVEARIIESDDEVVNWNLATP